MAKRAPAKRVRKVPSGRRVPPGANRTARNFTIGVSVSKEERVAIVAVARALDFRTGSALFGWFLENIFECARNPLHMAAWEADAVARIAGVKKLEARTPYEPTFTGSVLEEIAARIEPALSKSFGGSEKRESVVSAPDTSRTVGPP